MTVEFVVIADGNKTLFKLEQVENEQGLNLLKTYWKAFQELRPLYPNAFRYWLFKPILEGASCPQLSIDTKTPYPINDFMKAWGSVFDLSKEQLLHQRLLLNGVRLARRQFANLMAEIYWNMHIKSWGDSDGALWMGLARFELEVMYAIEGGYCPSKLTLSAEFHHWQWRHSSSAMRINIHQCFESPSPQIDEDDVDGELKILVECAPEHTEGYYGHMLQYYVHNPDAEFFLLEDCQNAEVGTPQHLELERRKAFFPDSDGRIPVPFIDDDDDDDEED